MSSEETPKPPGDVGEAQAKVEAPAQAVPPPSDGAKPHQLVATPVQEPPRQETGWPAWFCDPDDDQRDREARWEGELHPFFTDPQGHQLLRQVVVSPVLMGPYAQLEALLRERRANFIVAFGLNVRRNGFFSSVLEGVVGGSVVGTVAYAGHPILGVFLGGATALARRVRDVRRVRAKNHHKKTSRKRLGAGAQSTASPDASKQSASHGTTAFGKVENLPPIAEFMNPWLLGCWTLVRIMYGYNVRVNAVNAIVSDAASTRRDMDAARQMAQLLIDSQPRIAGIQRLLADSQIATGSKESIAALGDRFKFEDFFGTADDPPIGWLPFEHSTLPKAEFHRQLGLDLAVASGEVDRQEMDEKIAVLERTERTARVSEQDLHPDAPVDVELGDLEGKD